MRCTQDAKNITKDRKNSFLLIKGCSYNCRFTLPIRIRYWLTDLMGRLERNLKFRFLKLRATLTNIVNMQAWLTTLLHYSQDARDTLINL